MGDAICVIGAGCSGLAAVKALSERGLPVECFERGSNVGGNWRYENDSGLSAAYASLCCNVSRRHMEYPRFPMPRAYGDFPHHTHMAAYLDAYADSFGLRRHIRFRTPVERIERAGDAGWRVRVRGGEEKRYRAVVVANGHHWDPAWPSLPGDATIPMVHAREYRTPDRFAGQRVLIIGAGQSGIEIATDICRVAAKTFLSVRRGVHLIPRYLLQCPFDTFDVPFLNRLPWPLLNGLVRRLVSATHRDDPRRYAFPSPSHRVLEQIPTVSSSLLPALRAGLITAMPAVEGLDGSRVRFVDGSTQTIDAIICATGYRVRFPFLSRAVLTARGKQLPLYRRIVPTGVPDLYFIGLVEPPGGLPPIVAMQSAWLADLLDGTTTLPEPGAMRAAIERAERRTIQRFPRESPHSIRCDPHAYRRVLARDRRWALYRAFLPI